VKSSVKHAPSRHSDAPLLPCPVRRRSRWRCRPGDDPGAFPPDRSRTVTASSLRRSISPMFTTNVPGTTSARFQTHRPRESPVLRSHPSS
jgi:hypothetical protein